MTRRTINFTQRQSIRKRDAQIAIHENQGTDAAWFGANLSLGRYAFPAEALIFVEAYRRTQRIRIGYGTVGNIMEPNQSDRILSGFDPLGMILFRVKVVNAQTGLIIGEVDRLNPDGNNSALKSLLPVEPADDLGQSCWKIDFDIDTMPVLLVNKKLKPTWKDACSSREFKSLVYPAVLQDILNRILHTEEHFEIEGDGWQSLWLKFAVQNIEGDLPSDSFSENEIDLWINDVVFKFCTKLKSLTEYNKEYDNE